MAKPDVYTSVEALKICIFCAINKRENPYNSEGWEGSWCCRCSARCWLVVQPGALQPAVLLLLLPALRCAGSAGGQHGLCQQWCAQPHTGGGWHFLQVWEELSGIDAGR